MSRSRREFIRAAVKYGAGAIAGSALVGCATEGQHTVTPKTGSEPRPSVNPSPGAKSSSKASPLSLLVLGGTSFLGPQIVERAIERGHRVTLFNRGRTNPQLFPDLEKLRGDRDGNLGALQNRRWDAVVDTSGYVPRVVKASAELLAPSVNAYVFISTMSVYADTSVPGMDENAALATLDDPTNEDVRANYGALKALCEKMAEAAMPGRVLNLRPGLIVGPGDVTDRYTYWPVRVARGGDVLAPGDGTDPVQYIDARDLAAFVVHGLEKRLSGTLNVNGPAHWLTMADLLESCRTASNSNAKFVWADTAFLEKQKVAPWSDMPVWVPASGDTAGFHRVSSARAIAAGLTFRSAVDTARDTLTWFKAEPAERQAALRAGLKPAREAELLKLLQHHT